MVAGLQGRLDVLDFAPDNGPHPVRGVLEGHEIVSPDTEAGQVGDGAIDDEMHGGVVPEWGVSEDMFTGRPAERGGNATTGDQCR